MFGMNNHKPEDYQKHSKESPKAMRKAKSVPNRLGCYMTFPRSKEKLPFLKESPSVAKKYVRQMKGKGVAYSVPPIQIRLYLSLSRE
jgi:hypothetical protein